MKVFAKSDIGKARNQNEDYYYVSDNEIKLYILADGMGGYNGGEIASKLAIQTAKSYIENNIKEINKDKESILQLVGSAMEYANMINKKKAKENNLDIKGAKIVDPNNSKKSHEYTNLLYELRKHKN